MNYISFTRPYTLEKEPLITVQASELPLACLWIVLNQEGLDPGEGGTSYIWTSQRMNSHG